MRITIQRTDGRQEEIDAHVYGAFAVHAPDGAPLKYVNPDVWHAVTHVKTGYRVCDIKGRREAASVARKLNRFLPEGDFTVEDFETETYKAFVSQAKLVVKATRTPAPTRTT